jgi:hypothetical protein
MDGDDVEDVESAHQRVEQTISRIIQRAESSITPMSREQHITKEHRAE